MSGATVRQTIPRNRDNPTARSGLIGNWAPSSAPIPPKAYSKPTAVAALAGEVGP
jgi:hypothetical protein